MKPLDPVVFSEMSVIRKIIEDETWLEGERRGCQVPSDDRVVKEHVCEVILRIGQQLRDSIDAAKAKSGTAPSNVTPLPLPSPNMNDAA